MQKITAVKGMNDVLPSESYSWLWLEEILREWLDSYGYENIRMPIVEDTKLFVRSIGEATDIVEKEMYTFIDSLNNDSLTLRPEGTAGTLRAVAEHNLLYNATQKLWYMGPMFRHERPQKGRYRQFHQLGVEALGFKGPDIDTEMVLMQYDLWQRLGLEHLQLHINSLGNKEERANHRQELIKYLLIHQDKLDEDSQRRLHSNPLRILDSKNPDLREVIENAPKLMEFLGTESIAHYNQFKANLYALQISFIENGCLVRGLDYYNLTVFEWMSSNLGAQGTVAAGGRYDPLVLEISGRENFAIGFAIGLERILLELQTLDKLPLKNGIDIFIANFGDGTHELAFKTAVLLRNNGYKVIQNMGENSFKSQLKKANALDAEIAIIIGEDEVAANAVLVKRMQEETQEVVAMDELIQYLESF